jgi:hypothetical protein
MASQNDRTEWRLMWRGFFALLSKKVSIEPLLDADMALELSRSPGVKEEHQRAEYRPILIGRLRLLRQNFVRSFLLLITATMLALVVSRLVSTSNPSWIGIGSLFCLAWSTVTRLGYAGQSFGGDSVIERLDDEIFRVLFWLGTFLGILSLASGS